MIQSPQVAKENMGPQIIKGYVLLLNNLGSLKKWIQVDANDEITLTRMSLQKKSVIF